ncbi:MAG: DUF167 domain-containing protein [Candidatus Paceibacterota bacterium]|jgi:hypothetical protein
MKILVKVKPKTRIGKVAKKADGSFEVWVKEPPVEGRANEAVVKALAEFFGVSKSAVRIIKGGKSKQKIVEVL